MSLTTITLHYYTDSVRGLPRLRFYAVPDDFDIWDGLAGTAHPYVDVAAIPRGREPAGRKNISINVNLNVSFYTEKILLYKFKSTSAFAVSEVKFLNCTQAGMVHA